VAAGTVIFLNGASSSGKGTLAHALQASLDRMFLHVEMDFVFVAMENAGYNGAVPLGETIPSMLTRGRRSSTMTRSSYGSCTATTASEHSAVSSRWSPALPTRATM
jgi:chloramphenicol 3-O-phosphotransferase